MDPITDFVLADISITGLLGYLGETLFASSVPETFTEYSVLAKDFFEEDGIEAITNIAKDQTGNIVEGGEIANKETLLKLYNGINSDMTPEQFFNQADIIARKLESKGINITNDKGFNLMRNIINSAKKYKTEIVGGTSAITSIASIPAVAKIIKKIKIKKENDHSKASIDEIKRYFF